MSLTRPEDTIPAMKMTVATSSPEETHKLGVRIGRALKGHDVLLLDGELGAGKTLLTKGLYVGLSGKDEEQVLSPSYTLVHQYDDARLPIYHIDLFRLEKPDAILGLDYEEFLFANPGVTVIEWPRGARSLLAEDDFLSIRFTPSKNPRERTIELATVGDHYAQVFAELMA